MELRRGPGVCWSGQQGFMETVRTELSETIGGMKESNLFSRSKLWKQWVGLQEARPAARRQLLRPER